MGKIDKKHPLPKQDELIEITDRYCSDKVQPSVKVGASYIVKRTENLKDGTLVLVVYSHSDSKKEQRINASRFGWMILTQDILKERAFIEECKRDTQEIQDKFSFDEHIFIAFVPLIFAHLAFYYAGKCRRYAADKRISILKKLGRAYDALEREYDREIGKDLDYKHRQNIKDEAMRFIEEYQKDFQILWFSVNQEFKKKMPEWPYSDMRSEAICGMIMIDLYNEHNKSVDALIASRLGGCKNSIKNPKIEALYSILDAYAGEVGKFDFQEKNVQLAKAVICNRVQQINFQITKD